MKLNLGRPHRKDARDKGGDEQENRWVSHRVGAFCLRATVRVAPPLVALGLSLLALVYLPKSFTGHWWPGRIVLLLASLGAAFAVERVARRLLPLAVLLQLTLLFPDRAPSRLKVARAARQTNEDDDQETSSEAGTATQRILELLALLTAHDSKTRGHAERVRLYADMLADQLNLSKADQDRLRWVALLHDIGKLKVDPEVLNKPGKPSDQEWAVLRSHPEQGAKLAAPLIEWLGEWGAGVVEHHERYDGTGYPAGVAGDQISRAGRLLAIVDAYEVMTAARAYKRAMPARAARAELAACAGTHFDPVMVRAFLAISLPRMMVTTGPLGLLAQLPWLSRLGQIAQQAPTALSAAASTTAVTALTVTGLVATAAPTLATTDSTPVAIASTTIQPSRSPSSSPRALPSVIAVLISSEPTPTVTPTVTPTDIPTGTVSPTSVPSTNTQPIPSTTPQSPPVVLAGTPAAPGTVTTVPGSQQVSVSWSAPLDDGGSPVTHYTVTAVDSGGPLVPVAVNAASTTTVVTGLSNGTSYTFLVTASNANGTSPAAASGSVMPVGPPAPPSAVAASAGDRQAMVSWTPPASDGGSPIISYTVIPTDSGGPLTAINVGPGATSTVVTGLSNGTPYTFAISAVNAVGAQVSAPSTAVMPVGVPDAPATVTAIAGPSSATVSWTPPPADGGATISHYTVDAIGPGGPFVPIDVSAAGPMTTTVPGLTDGGSYTFTVTATNSVGTSSAATGGPVTPATTPSAPTAVAATASDQQATVFWGAPTSDGGDPISSYTVTTTGVGAPGPITVAGNSTGAIVTGLTNGSAYTFTITAVNAVGSSPAATSAPVTPMAPAALTTAPSAPTSASATAGLSSATVSWSAPSSDGGSPITSYTLTQLNGATTVATWQVPAASTSQTIGGLSSATAFTFTITATNAVGTSAAATTNPVSAISAPAPVTSAVATSGIAMATLTWTAPATDGGSPITSYTITPTGPGGPLAPISVAAPATTATVTGLTNDVSYTFTITANTAYATSAPTTTAAISPGLTARADTIYVVRNQPVVVHVLDNDHGTFPAAATSVISSPTNGSGVANADNTITYQPSHNYEGNDQLTYRACDVSASCATAIVTIHVLDPNQQNANFAGVDMTYANLQGVDFSNANLTGTVFTNANLASVKFTGATLTNAVFTGATLTAANFTNVVATGSNLAGTDLTGLHFTGANLNGANLAGANLSNADLDNVTVNTATNLTGTNLTGVHGSPAPAIAADTASTTIGHPITINLLSLVTDPQAPINAGSITITTQPSHGTLTVNSDHTVTYTPNFLFLGNDSFTFRIANVLTFTNSSTVHLKVTL